MNGQSKRFLTKLLSCVSAIHLKRKLQRYFFPMCLQADRPTEQNDCSQPQRRTGIFCKYWLLSKPLLSGASTPHNHYHRECRHHRRTSREAVVKFTSNISSASRFGSNKGMYMCLGSAMHRKAIPRVKSIRGSIQQGMDSVCRLDFLQESFDLLGVP